MPVTKKMLEEFEEVVREHAFRGTYHPSDALAIERNYNQIKAELLQEIDNDSRPKD